MLGGVALNQNRSLAAVAPSQSFEEPEIRGGIENCVLAITERVRQSSNDAENLHFLAFSRDGDFRPVLASPIKMSAQCRERAFSKGGIDAAVPLH